MSEAVRMLHSMERSGMSDSDKTDRRYVERIARQYATRKRLRASCEPANVSQLSRDDRVSCRTSARHFRELSRRGMRAG